MDYGYSKTVEEAYRSWDREAVLEDMVRVIRLNRPLVVVARFHGSRRDGHGHHHASGLLTPEAVEAAADPARFPGQIEEEGLRPWRVLRTYRGGIRVDEPFQVEVDARGESPWVGTSFQAWASRGLGLQRSQTAGRVRVGGGLYRYELRDGGGSADARGRADEALPASRAEDSFFAGLDTSLNGLPALLGETASPETSASLAQLQGLIDEVVAGLDFRAPGQSVPHLVRGLGLLRSAIASSAGTPETQFQLRLKERQFEDAIAAASGLRVEAGLPGGAAGAVVVPGQSLAVGIVVEVSGAAGSRGFGSPGRRPRRGRAGPDFRLCPGGEWLCGRNGGARARGGCRCGRRRKGGRAVLRPGRARAEPLPGDRLGGPAPSVAATRPVGCRRPGGGGDNHSVHRPLTAPVPRLPYGTVTRPVEVLPALSVVVDPAVRVVPEGGADAADGPTIQVRVTANTAPLPTTTRLEVPAGWDAAPATVAHDFARAGEVSEVAFVVTPPGGWEGAATIQAVSRAGGREYRTGYQTIDHRDLRLARLWRPATTTVRSVPVARLDGARVGYVMGVGDEVPAGIEALGAQVELLDEAALANPASLSQLDAIVVGTRAYAVRDDLLEHNQRLIEYARAGGHLVILYQTQEFVPEEMAPYPASLPRGAEEVSEEDAPVRLLQPAHPFMTTPNRITEADFDGWVEQRGSKFFTEWDAAYTPLVETHDQGQDPQEGIWLTAEVGEGHYTYLALALHRQLPYGVPGAFRILSNVLSAGAGR